MIRQAMRSVSTAILLILSTISVAAAPDPFDGTIEGAHLLNMIALRGEVFHVQGLEIDDAHIWVTSVDTRNHRGYIHEFDRASGRFLRRLELTDGERYHPGGISIAGRSIWVPVAELRPDSSTVLVEIDVDSLRVRRRIRVADHLGCVAASNDMLVAGNWDSELLYVFDLTGRAAPRIVANPTRTRYQDMKFVDGHLVGSGPQTLWSGAIDWFDWPTMTLVRTVRAGVAPATGPFGAARPFTSEGMTIKGRDLYVLPEDGPSRIFHFRMDTKKA